MKQFFLLILVSLMFVPQVDACVCSGGSSFLSLSSLSTFRYNFIGTEWKHNSFQSFDEQGREIRDAYNTFRISGQYYISDKWVLNASLSYINNLRDLGDNSMQREGLGDSYIGVNYNLINNKSFCQGILFIGLNGGVSIPTGNFDRSIYQSTLPFGFNQGKGSFGFNISPVFNIDFEDISLNSTFNYRINTNSDDYIFGNQFLYTFNMYKTFSIGDKLNIIPSMGWSFESNDQDKYPQGAKVYGTGGNSSSLVTSLNINFSDLLIGFNYEIPVTRNYEPGSAEIQERFSINLNYIF